MQLLFLGTGSAFTVGVNNYHSNMLLTTDDNQHLLIDCGSDARLSLYEQGFDFKNIEHVYISHLHADHAGGLEWLGFTRKFANPPLAKPHLYASQELHGLLWNKCLAAGMLSLHEKVANFSDYFSPHFADISTGFTWQKIHFNLIKTIHIHNGDNIMPSFGLLFKANQTTVMITTDTQYTPDYLMDYYQKADIIFHDCEILASPSGVHAHFTQLQQLPQTIKQKTWLYHYNPGTLPDAKAQGFAGFVQRGQRFVF